MTIVPIQIEPEIEDAMRALATTQELFTGESDDLPRRSPIPCSWYDAGLDPRRGAFALVREGQSEEELVGDFLRLRHGTRSVNVYCLAATPSISTPIAVQRRPFLALAPLYMAEINIEVEVLT